MIQEFIQENWKYALWILFCSGFIFEISPIKFSPISSILGWIGRKMNKDINIKLAKIEEKVDSVQDDLQTHKIESWRRNILEFEDSLIRKEKKTRENFDNVLDLYDQYDAYIKKNNINNGKIDLAIKYIRQTYRECQDNNSFL